eukprot:3521884-Alexandrium_andersonii.AAC.1
MKARPQSWHARSPSLGRPLRPITRRPIPALACFSVLQQASSHHYQVLATLHSSGRIATSGWP